MSARVRVVVRPCADLDVEQLWKPYKDMMMAQFTQVKDLYVDM